MDTAGPEAIGRVLWNSTAPEPNSGCNWEIQKLLRITQIRQGAWGLIPSVDQSSALRRAPNKRINRKSVQKTGEWTLLVFNLQQWKNPMYSPMASLLPPSPPPPIPSCSAQILVWLLRDPSGQCPLKGSYCRECSQTLCNCSADGVMVSQRIQPSNSNDTAGLSCLMGSFPLYYNCDFQLNNSRVFLDPLRWKTCWICYVVSLPLSLFFFLFCFSPAPS